MVKALSTPEVYKGWGFSSAPTPGDVFKQFGSDPIYLLRLPAIELQRLVNTPCPGNVKSNPSQNYWTGREASIH